MEGQVSPVGELALRVIRGSNWIPRNEDFESIWTRVRSGLPFGLENREVRLWRYRNLPNILRGMKTIALVRMLHLPSFWGELYLKRLFANGRVLDLGLAGLRVVTDAGVAFIVDAFQNTAELENMKYHGIGTGTGNEAAGDIALGGELTTEYATDNVRPTGTTVEGATANIFKTVGTITIDSGTPAITEHGVFSDATRGNPTLLDRTKFTAINLVANDGIQATYQFTLTSGS